MGNNSSISIENEQTKLFLTYDDILELIKQNIDWVKNKNPTCILAIGSGGLIPAKMIKAYINIPIYVVTINAYDDSDNLKNNIKIVQWMDNNLSDENVLIVDDVDDTRTSLSFCIDKLKKQNKLDFNKTSVLVLHNKNKVKKDILVNFNEDNYRACKDINDIWIVYPWENKLI